MQFKIIAAALIVITALLGAIGFVWQQTRVMGQKMETLDQTIGTLQQSLKSANGTIITLQQQNAERAQQQATLRQALERSQSDANQRIQKLKALQDEQLNAWSSQPLPNPIKRLRQRPSIRGANAYRHYLRDTEPLPALAQ
ncbi:putative P2 LysB family protein [gamma proteobacterium HTCC5015]|nr:putative P2 LysB family protein [gamma proteobacterium HTCC5015]